MSDLTRRSLLKLGSALLAGGLSPLQVSAQLAKSGSAPGLLGRLDYTKAKASPTICFACTNHCGVIGWVENGIVRKIEGNPLDPNSEGNICSKAQGMISYTYYPERILFCQHRTDVGMEPACVSNCPTEALVFGDLDDPESKISRLATKTKAKAWKAEEGTNPSVLYVSHDAWMEKKANTGVQLDPKDEDVTYEQNNLKK